MTKEERKMHRLNVTIIVLLCIIILLELSHIALKLYMG